ncbi:MAG: methionine ABC transporter permease [Firmicutes bacterium]|nr:methionine ABC transporter permease [Bacillota bacterium]MBO2521265.1 methionine ABC transporter permease [Bacillota bacterium]
MLNPQVLQLLWQATLETLYMVACSSALGALFGLPVGVLLVVTAPGHILPNRVIHRITGVVVNIGRSVPFVILMIAIIPFTRMIAGTSIGTTAAIVPLTVSAIPYVARLVESALSEVDFGVIEAAESMGATPLQIIWKVLLPESLPSLVLGFTITTVSLVSYSAMAGAIGGGGLGDLAIRYGYQRFRSDIMIQTVVVLVVLVQLVQMAGNALARRLDHRHPS